MSPLPPWTTRAAALALALTLAACTARRPPADQVSTERRMRVVTTVLPITLFTRAVAGDCATVTALIQPNASPHDVQAKPGDLTALRQAKVLVKNGLGMEHFLDKLVAAADNPRLTVIDSSRNVAPIATATKEEDHHHAPGHAHGAVNPHIWLDPLRAVEQVEAIRDGLVKADPACADAYKRNAAAYIAQLRQLNSALARQLKPYAGKTFIAFHDVAPYFAQRYGLKAIFLVDVPELNPSPADLRRVASAVRQSQLKALMSEPQEGPGSFNTLAQDLGLRIHVFDPLETGSEATSRDPATYGQVMRRNVAGLVQAFGGGGGTASGHGGAEVP
ncbi:MAG: metal ABC transporter solute-binding protein, Zn/Mn family [Cyanobacteriota bacterium]